VSPCTHTYEPNDCEWSISQPPVANKPQRVPGADDRKVLNGIYWRLRTGLPSADIPVRYGPPTTSANRFRRGLKIGVWDRIAEAVSKAYDGDPQMIDASSARVHQHGSNIKKEARMPRQPRLGTTLEPSAWGTRAAA
jgi:transposase